MAKATGAELSALTAYLSADALVRPCTKYCPGLIRADSRRSQGCPKPLQSAQMRPSTPPSAAAEIRLGFWRHSREVCPLLPVAPARNDGATIHELTVQGVPVDGFWSITVYNAEGHLEPNQYNVYSVSGITAKKGADGLVIQFGGCDGEIPNCLPIMKAWNTRCDSFARDPNPRWHIENSRRRSL